jgi:hypothetical protein
MTQIQRCSVGCRVRYNGCYGMARRRHKGGAPVPVSKPSRTAPADADRGALRHDTLFGVEELFQHGPVSLRHRSLECCAGRPKTGPPEQVTYALAERSHIFATANHHKMPSTAERTSGANMCAAVEYSVIINASCAIYAWALTCSQEPGILFLSASHVAPPLATPTMSL